MFEAKHVQVPFTERVKISSTNIRLETTVPQKEETFQVVIDLVKNSTCFKAFTISADVPKIFMQQFWYSIKKVQGTDSYEFLLDNKKCTVNAEVFRIILDICPRVEGVDFMDVPDDDTTLTFLIDLGYKGPLYKHTNMFVDHIHQPWRTLVAIINKCLSGKMASNDKLRKSRIDILWGMFKRENVDYPELIWEDIAYQIDHRKEKISRRENMPYPQFTKIIINHFLKQHKSLTNLNYQHYHTIKEDGIETVDVSEESEPEPKPARKNTSSKRRVKKKVTLSTDDNIISNDPDAALEIMTEHVPESTRRRKSGKVTSDPPKKGDEQDSEYSDDDNDDVEKDDKDGDADDEGDDHISDTQDVDDEDVKTESDEDDIYKYKIRVRKDEDEEMLNAEVDDSNKGDEEVTDAAKADAEKTSEVKDDAKKTELPPSSSSLSVSSGFGDQFLKLSSDSPLVSTVKDTTDSEINSLLEVKIQSEVPHTQSPSMLSVPVSVISEPTVLIHKIDLSAEALAALKTQVPSVVDSYLGSKVGDVFQKELKKHTTDLIQKYYLQQIPESSKKQTPTLDLEHGSEKSASGILKIKREQAEKQHTPKFTIKSTDKAALEEYDLKSTLYQSMHANKSFNRNPTNHRLYHALMEALIED
ncbi:hypothetical protein Tco_0801356 [Tanacetum coccineum]|uniref:BTB domain-containing protein n=1 Tax=Tanacetum coccineum TaxID=301880 RepID=A0ABQ5A035_9ASTR